MDDNKTANELTKHLEYLGYQTEAQPDGWHYATHPVRFNIHFRPIELGFRLHCVVWVGNTVASRRAWLQFVNRANESSVVARFTFGRDEEGTYYVRMRALLPGRYDRRLFGLLLDAWHEDLSQMRRAPREEPVEKDDNATEAKPSVVVN